MGARQSHLPCLKPASTASSGMHFLFPSLTCPTRKQERNVEQSRLEERSRRGQQRSWQKFGIKQGQPSTFVHAHAPHWEACFQPHPILTLRLLPSSIETLKKPCWRRPKAQLLQHLVCHTGSRKSTKKRKDPLHVANSSKQICEGVIRLQSMVWDASELRFISATLLGLSRDRKRKE